MLKITARIPNIGIRPIDLDVTKIGYIVKRTDSHYDIYFGSTISANIEVVTQEDYDKIMALRSGLERQDRMDSVLTE